jgi:hypothetical protein
METSQITVLVERETLRWFRAECIRRKTTPTKEIARLVKARLDEWLNDLEIQMYHEREEEDVHR